jgi:hypothetical protein
MVLKMTKKKKEKVIYLVTNAHKKAPLINLYSLPTKCPVCHSFQEPKPTSFQFNKNDDAMVQFSCINDSCKSSFSAFYIKGTYGNEQYHFISFI